jgi:glycosyltransferase involved in cell wall biosynthesis
MSRKQIAMIVSGFPRRSETFAVNELLGLCERGLLAGIYATKPGEDGELQPGCDRLLPFVETLPGRDVDEQGCALAERLAARHLRGIHGYFAHTPAALAEFAGSRLGVPFGFSVHAKDGRKVAPAVLRARAARASCVVACNDDVARLLLECGAPAHLVPHGVDLDRFRPVDRCSRRELRVLAVGRLVPKKGFDVLIDAVAALRPDVTLRIVGDGPEREPLTARIAAHALGDRVTLAGACTHSVLPDEYSAADVVVVPSVVDAGGDRDGLPNVVLEAMASGLPVVGTDVGAIGRAVIDRRTGLVAPAGSAPGIAAALSILAADPDLRLRLGRDARTEVECRYALHSCVDRFARLLEVAYD